MQKTILITGASQGIGLCCALGLKERGYTVFATARTLSDLEKLRQQGLHAIFLDVNDSTSIQEAVAQVLKITKGRLDFLCNNAGFGQPGAVEDLTRDVIRKQFEINVFGLIELTNLIIPVMRRQGSGRIINVSSILGLVTLAYRGAYNASKYAVEGFTDTLRQELRDTPIKVILIEPGPITSHFRASAYAAFKQNVTAKDSTHLNAYEKLETYFGDTVDKNHTSSKPPEYVLAKLIDALENPKPKIRYYVTSIAHLLAFLKRILPDRAMDWILYNVSFGKQKKKT